MSKYNNYLEIRLNGGIVHGVNVGDFETVTLNIQNGKLVLTGREMSEKPNLGRTDIV